MNIYKVLDTLNLTNSDIPLYACGSFLCFTLIISIYSWYTDNKNLNYSYQDTNQQNIESKEERKEHNLQIVKEMSTNSKILVLAEVVDNLTEELRENKKQCKEFMDKIIQQIDLLEKKNKTYDNETDDNKKFLQILNHRITRLEDNFEEV